VRPDPGRSLPIWLFSVVVGVGVSACLFARRFQEPARLRPRRTELLLAAEHRGTEQLLRCGLGRLEQPARLCLCPLENGSGVKGGLLALLLSLLVGELKYLQHPPADPFMARTPLRLRRDSIVAGGQKRSASVFELRLQPRDPGLELGDAVLHLALVMPRGDGLDETTTSVSHGLPRLGVLSRHRVLALGTDGAIAALTVPGTGRDTSTPGLCVRSLTATDLLIKIFRRCWLEGPVGERTGPLPLASMLTRDSSWFVRTLCGP
jgi:hypothetical protein